MTCYRRLRKPGPLGWPTPQLLHFAEVINHGTLVYFRMPAPPLPTLAVSSTETTKPNQGLQGLSWGTDSRLLPESLVKGKSSVSDLPQGSPQVSDFGKKLTQLLPAWQGFSTDWCGCSPSVSKVTVYFSVFPLCAHSKALLIMLFLSFRVSWLSCWINGQFKEFPLKCCYLVPPTPVSLQLITRLGLLDLFSVWEVLIFI